MKYFRDQLHGSDNIKNMHVPEIRSRTKKRKKRANRKQIFRLARINAIDERILSQVKSGKLLKQARPHTLGQIRRFNRRGKVGEWTKMGMSKKQMFALKKKIDWSTG